MPLTLPVSLYSTSPLYTTRASRYIAGNILASPHLVLKSVYMLREENLDGQPQAIFCWCMSNLSHSYTFKYKGKN